MLKKISVYSLFCLTVMIFSFTGCDLFGGGGSKTLQLSKVPVTEGHYPHELAVYNNKLYFFISPDDNPYNYKYLTVIDGNNDPVAVSGGGFKGTERAYFTVFGNKLYFAGYQDLDGCGLELWVKDGDNDPARVYDINNGADGSKPMGLTVFNDKLYFYANDGIHGQELFVYDGVNTPTLVYDINTGSLNSRYPSGVFEDQMIVFNDRLYFYADDGSYGNELWSYNGTDDPAMVSDSNGGSGNFWPHYFAVFNDKLYFQGVDASGDQELWVYDGTTDPERVVDLNTTGDSIPVDLYVFNNKLRVGIF